MAWGFRKKKQKNVLRKKPVLDYDEIQWALLEMKPDWRLFKMIKKEMISRGHWKGKPRGRPFEEGYDPRRINK